VGGDAYCCVDGICRTQVEVCGLPMTKGAGGSLCAVVGSFPAGVAQEITELRKLLGGHCLHNALQLRV
jgi:hypothetical protein